MDVIRVHDGKSEINYVWRKFYMQREKSQDCDPLPPKGNLDKCFLDANNISNLSMLKKFPIEIVVWIYDTFHNNLEIKMILQNS